MALEAFDGVVEPACIEVLKGATVQIRFAQ